MKIAFITRATVFSSPGGDTRQMSETAAALRSLGVEVDIRLANQVIDYRPYDLLHVFNIIRPADIISHVQRSQRPYVVTLNFVEYGGVPEDGRGRWRGALTRLLSDSASEYVKTLARAWRNGERIVSRDYLRWGQARSVAYVARQARKLLPNSESDYARFIAKYSATAAYRVVPNGIRADLGARAYPPTDPYRRAVLCMGRIEARKNQLNLIRALNHTPYQLFIHGTPSPNHRAYFDQCRREAAPNVHIGEWLDDEALYRTYASAKVHVLPSYFETTGLSSLEAAALGCNLVVSPNGDTREYFQDDAWYCDPDSPTSIRAAVDAAYQAPPNQRLAARIRDRYTWNRAAAETRAAYEAVLQQESACSR
jgi:glycosyltransferase involved in cell wall biosynthesis